MTRRTAADGLVAFEAMLWLMAAAVVRQVLPFSALVALAGRPTRSPRGGDNGRIGKGQQVGWAVTVMARRLPWSPACFDQALAAQTMLRWRRVPSTMFFGAGWNSARALEAHVWVRQGGHAVVGCELASGFMTLASFPPSGLEP